MKRHREATYRPRRDLGQIPPSQLPKEPILKTPWFGLLASRTVRNGGRAKDKHQKEQIKSKSQRKIE